MQKPKVIPILIVGGLITLFGAACWLFVWLVASTPLVVNTSDYPEFRLVDNSKGMQAARIQAEIRKSHMDVNRKNGNGVTPLHATVLMNPDSVQVWINEGAKVNECDENGNTPLHVAVQTEKLRVAEILIKNGADSHIRNKDGETPSDILMVMPISDQAEKQRIIKLLSESKK